MVHASKGKLATCQPRARVHPMAALPLYQPLHLESEERHDEEREAPRMMESLAWGSVAECTLSICCPLVMRGPIDVSATALNLLCPLLGGAAQALDEATGGSASVHMRVSAFQTGLVGVATSFSFMAEQASLFSEWWRGCAYIIATICGACISFAAGKSALSFALRVRRFRRALVAGRVLPSSSRLLRILAFVVLLAWLWVLLSPAGTVYDPLAVNVARAQRAQAALDALNLRAGRALGQVRELPTDEPAPPASKRADCLHLLCGLIMQALGLAVSARVSERVATRSRRGKRGGASERLGLLVIAPLLSNALSCGVLASLRAAEAARWVNTHGFVASKARTSFCGALSISGMLAAMVISPPERAAASAKSMMGARSRGVINLLLHGALAAAAMLMMPWLQAWATARMVA